MAPANLEPSIPRSALCCLIFSDGCQFGCSFHVLIGLRLFLVAKLLNLVIPSEARLLQRALRIGLRQDIEAGVGRSEAAASDVGPLAGLAPGFCSPRKMGSRRWSAERRGGEQPAGSRIPGIATYGVASVPRNSAPDAV
jgi:hypothetical protein